MVRWDLLFLLCMGAIILLYQELNYEKKITNRAAFGRPAIYDYQASRTSPSITSPSADGGGVWGPAACGPPSGGV
jgi:hypothetical protein